ncbi:unnamed protein product [Closterium sp. NIES-53]
MGIRRTVRRSIDTHVFHTNIDTHVFHTDIDTHVFHTNIDTHVFHTNIDTHVFHTNIDTHVFHTNIDTHVFHTTCPPPPASLSPPYLPGALSDGHQRDSVRRGTDGHVIHANTGTKVLDSTFLFLYPLFFPLPVPLPSPLLPSPFPQEHCLMGIRGTVRRSTDGHVIHANIDTDVLISEQPPFGSTEKPEELYSLIEHFALGRRRIELFGADHNIRAGWLTVGKSLTSSNFNPQTYCKLFAGPDGKVWQGTGRGNPPPGAPHLLVTTPEIEALRPKSPPNRQQHGNQPQAPIQPQNQFQPPGNMGNNPPFGGMGGLGGHAGPGMANNGPSGGSFGAGSGPGSLTNGVIPRVGRPFKQLGLLVSATWLENKAVVDAPSVPLPLAFDLWMDRELIPSWMPWIASVKVRDDKPELSTWTLRYTAFGQNLEFSWLAKNLQPIHHQKIHWRSLDGLPNSGAVRFFPSGPNGCKLEMTISYEVPGILVPVANSLAPLVQSIIQADLERFVEYAKKIQQQKA